MDCFSSFLVRLCMWNVLAPMSSASAVVNNRMTCPRLCFSNTNCSSFIFNQETRRCHLYNKWLKTLETSHTPNSIYYYQVYSDTCGGFQYEYQYIRKGAMCLKFHEDRKLWSDANNNCESEGARLVKIDTEEKNNAIMEILKDHESLYIHMGARDAEQNGELKWTDGSALQYTNWDESSGEPDESGNCVRIMWSSSKSGWYDGECSYPLKYICERVRPL